MNSEEFRLSKLQNGHGFGFIPLTDVKYIRAPKVVWSEPVDILTAYASIRDSRLWNFWKCRISVETQAKPKIWAQKLKDFWGQQLPDLRTDGFLLA